MNYSLSYIKEFIKIYKEESLFLFDYDLYNKKQSVDMFLLTLNFEEEKKRVIIDKTIWIFFSIFGPIGFYVDENDISAVINIDEEQNIKIFCKNIEDIPFEIIRRKSESWIDNNNKTIEEFIKNNYLYKIPEFIHTYTKYMKNNGIMVDPDNIYYNKHGKLFNYYFELDYIIDKINL